MSERVTRAQGVRRRGSVHARSRVGHPATGSATPTASARQPADPRRGWRRAAALLISLGGAELVVYSGLLPVPFGPAGVVYLPFAGLGIGITLGFLGFAGIVAAAGVWRGSGWGRVAAGVVTVLNLGYEAWYRLAISGLGTDPVDAAWWIASLAVPVGASGFVLFVLTRRWTTP